MNKEILIEVTKSTLAILIVLGAIASLFIPSVNEVGARLLQSFGTFVIGFYFGGKTIPFSSFILKK